MRWMLVVIAIGACGHTPAPAPSAPAPVPANAAPAPRDDDPAPPATDPVPILGPLR